MFAKGLSLQVHIYQEKTSSDVPWIATFIIKWTNFCQVNAFKVNNLDTP